jgi:hypothetical protein
MPELHDQEETRTVSLMGQKALDLEEKQGVSRQREKDSTKASRH